MATKTLGLTGRDYSTFAAYSSYVNALTFSADEFCDVYNDGGAVADTASVTIGGYTPGAFALLIRAASGQGFGDHANKLTNALRYNASNGAALTNSVAYAHPYIFSGTKVTLQGLQFRASASAASSAIQNPASSNLTIKNCILYKGGGASYVVNQGSTLRIDDSLLVHGGTSGGGITCGAAGLTINNSTIAGFSNSGKGFGSAYSNNPVVKNTVFYGFTTGVESTAGSGTTNNAVSNGTFGGTGWSTSGQVSVSSSDFENVTSGTEDFRIKAGSTKLIDLGAGSVGSGFDVVGTTRGATYDIGAWEVGASSALTGGITLDDITASGSISSVASSLAGGITLDDISASGALGLAPGVITTPVLKNNTGTALASLSGVVANVYNVSTGALVVRKTGLTSNGSGIVTITDAAIVSGTSYAYEIDLSASSLGRRLPVGVAA